MAIQLMVFVFGLCVGSFLNVCIYRLPAGVSIVFPGSRCPYCEHPIRAYDNVPILGWLLLRGRCRHCKHPIALRYPMVELLTGLTALACLLRFGPKPPALVYFLFCAALIVVAFIDIDHQIIPNAISLPGIPIGLGLSFFLPQLRFVDAVLGALVGGGSLYLVAWLYSLIKGLDGMGGGDIKLLAMIGTFVGWKGVIFTIFIGSVTGTAAGVAQMVARRKLNGKLRIPFGPFLAIGAMAYVFYGRELILWYLRFLGKAP